MSYISVLRVARIQQHVFLFSIESLNKVVELTLRLEYLLVLLLGCGVALTKLGINQIQLVVNL